MKREAADLYACPACRGSLSLSVDQGRAPDLRLGGETDNLRLRYGMKF